MKRLHTDQRGFAHLLLAVLVIAVLGTVAYAGYYVSQHNKKSETAKTQAKAMPAKLESDADFSRASQTLDTDENDAALDPAQLDADLNSLL